MGKAPKKRRIKLKRAQKRALLNLVLAAVLLILAFALIKILNLPWWASLLCVAPSYLLAGGKTLLCAIDNLFHGKLFDEKFLMSIASVGALALG